MKKTAALSIAGLILLSGCTATEPVRYEVGGDRPSLIASQTHAQGRQVADNETLALIQSSAQSKRSVTGFSGHSELRATYGGTYQGCDAVSVHNKQFNLDRHYLVCNGQVAKRNAVTPAVPSTRSGFDVAALESVKKDAYLRGSAESRYQGYLYRAERVGIPDGNGCVPVEVTVTRQGVLANQFVEKVCLD